MTEEVKETHATATTGKSEPRSGKAMASSSWQLLFASMFALYYYPKLEDRAAPADTHSVIGFMRA